MTKSVADTLFESLVEHLQRVGETFLLPIVSTPVLPYSQEDYFLRAYCVMCHAGFEEYFEQLVMAVWKHCWNNWDKFQILSMPLLHIISYYPPKKTEASTTSDAITHLKDTLKAAGGDFGRLVKDNHGIKPDNHLLKLLRPVGLEGLDPRLLGSLTNLAQQRGDVAHLAVSLPVATVAKNPIDPMNWVLDGIFLSAQLRDDANKLIT